MCIGLHTATTFSRRIVLDVAKKASLYSSCCPQRKQEERERESSLSAVSSTQEKIRKMKRGENRRGGKSSVIGHAPCVSQSRKRLASASRSAQDEVGVDVLLR